MTNFETHGITIIKAVAWDAEYDGRGALRLELGNDIRAVLFMPYSTALEYASAINACNDREAEEAYVPNENTVRIPIEVWRKFNMGVPDANENTDTDH